MLDDLVLDAFDWFMLDAFDCNDMSDTLAGYHDPECRYADAQVGHNQATKLPWY